MLPPLILFAAEVLLAICILVAIHVTALAAAGFAASVSVRQVSFGSGPKLLQFGKWVVRAIPFGGWVRFKDTRVDEGDQASAAHTSQDAYNHQNRIVQALIPLAGPLSLVAVALVLGYEKGLPETLSGFRQIFSGSLQPRSVAQVYIGATQSIAANGGFWALTGVLAAKFAAFNLVPLPMLNGGQALLSVLRKPGDETPVWEATVLKWGMLPWGALLLCWSYAFVYYMVRT